MQAALVGVTGYAGMVLYQLLKGHPNIKKINIYDHKLTAPLIWRVWRRCLNMKMFKFSRTNQVKLWRQMTLCSLRHRLG